jgi:hypothetical protein
MNDNEIYSSIYRQMTAYFNPSFGANGNYYYVDDTLNKIRFIALNTQDKEYAENADGSVVDNKMYNPSICQNQITWFATESLNVPNDSWNVIVFSHVPGGGDTLNGVSSTNMANSDLVYGILNAFKNKTSYTAAGTSSTYPASINVDFTNKGGNVVGWFSGHLHADKMYTVSSVYTVATLNDDKYVITGQPAKTAGTTTEQAFDIVTVNKNTRTVYLTRIGAGSDRSFTY